MRGQADLALQGEIADTERAMDARSTRASSTVERYSRTAILLHWLLALALLAQIGLGWFVDEVPRGTPARAFYVNLHKSIGLTLAILIVLRVYWRWRHPPPPWPPGTARWERIGAWFSHHALYACMLLMPLTGYIASNFSRWGVKLYNVVLLPPWGVDDKAIYALFNGAHVILSYAFVTLIALHVLGALRHLVRRDGMFQRMWPPRGGPAR